MRIAFTDGEMSNLQADFGQLLCACLVEYRAPTKSRPSPWTAMRTFTLRDYRGKRYDDKSLAIQWRDAMKEYDIIVTWNGIRFDLPFLNTRLQQWGEKEFVPSIHKDLMYTARYKLRLASSSLESVSNYLDIYDRYAVAKTKMEPRQWVRALGGDEKAYRYILHHCQQDVKVLAAIWQETKRLVTNLGAK